MMVSVCVITYKHEQFIEQTLENILSQQVNFDFEVIVSDDCSPDNTVAVINDFIARHPKGHLVKFYPQEKNIGVLPNFIFALKACTGKYTAICEGDDYWTNNTKLQQQVDFLEANTDYAICFHKASIVYGEGVEPGYPEINRHTPGTTTINDLAGGNFIHTPTVIFRNIMKGDFPAWFSTAYPGDWPLHIFNACYGKIKFMPLEMSAYRVHQGGVHSTKYKNIQYHQKILPTLKNLLAYITEKDPALATGRFYHMLKLRINMIDNSRNRFKRAYGLLNAGLHLKAKKVILFFWLPIVAGKHTKKQWDWLCS